MTCKPAEVRRFALSLPGVIEAPHHEAASFRVNGKIFATLPPGGLYAHLFVNEPDRQRAIAGSPAACEELLWGKRVAGLRVTLAAAKAAEVRNLLLLAWRAKAPPSLIREFER